jgi:DNA-directed RNA polymerase subunit K/omega
MSKKELSKEELSDQEDQDSPNRDQELDHDSTTSDDIDNEDDIGDGDGDADPDELDDDDDDGDGELEEKETDIEISEAVDDDDKCVHKYNKNNSDSEDDNKDDGDDGEVIGEIEDIFDDDHKNTSMIYVPNNMRITKPIMTKYERVRILGDRTRQLLGGAKPMIKGVMNMPAKDIAALELKYNLIPLKIERPLPNGKMEIWKISELKH